ncbi:hypothetical protein GHT06_001589 [Daphnia sinensis]|uniref:Uncharacterized protein n=1 Tax=Daphnia sinensis TaxID=1820382 RepID=A0AAD5KUZ4_9CRUS|nr:hypothetical protein GHT06_001589 [Daphnia sinensis]
MDMKESQRIKVQGYSAQGGKGEGARDWETSERQGGYHYATHWNGLRPHNRVQQTNVEECGEATGLNGTGRAHECVKEKKERNRENKRERAKPSRIDRPSAPVTPSAERTPNCVKDRNSIGFSTRLVTQTHTVVYYLCVTKKRNE